MKLNHRTLLAALGNQSNTQILLVLSIKNNTSTYLLNQFHQHHHQHQQYPYHQHSYHTAVTGTQQQQQANKTSLISKHHSHRTNLLDQNSFLIQQRDTQTANQASSSLIYTTLIRKMLNATIAISNMFNKEKQNKLPPISDPLLLTPAHKLSNQIKDGSLTSVKLCKVVIERIKQVQPFVNAMTQSRFHEALEEARQIDELLASFRNGKQESDFQPDEVEMLRSPLLGVPISIKESIMVKGMKNSCGLVSRKDVLATHDAVVVANVRRFGMVPICTTNIPECTLFWADCQNKVYGRSANPYDLSRITGASSGGEGSLIGSGATSIGIGSDIGGSLRIPAHYCGIFSHKSSPFLVSGEGNFPQIKESRLRLFTLGPMCRYASDLRPLLKCILSDKDNPKQDTYYKFQPKNISELRRKVFDKLDEQVDLSQLKFFYFNFNDSSELKGKQSIQVSREIMEAQQELIDHFRSKFNCQVEHINLDKYLKKAMITWQCMLRGGGVEDRDTGYDEYELEKTFEIDSLALEFIKMPLGLSKHTKESLLTLVVGAAVPKDRQKAFPMCEKFEQFAAELKQELENMLGETGILIMPTLPTTAYKHNVSLLKTADLRFPSMFNNLQLPVTHATMHLDKKHKLPFGFSVSSRQYNDALTISVAEEIELAFGGWREPTRSITANNHYVSHDQSTINNSGDIVLSEKQPAAGIRNKVSLNTNSNHTISNLAQSA